MVRSAQSTRHLSSCNLFGRLWLQGTSVISIECIIILRKHCKACAGEAGSRQPLLQQGLDRGGQPVPEQSSRDDRRVLMPLVGGDLSPKNQSGVTSSRLPVNMLKVATPLVAILKWRPRRPVSLWSPEEPVGRDLKLAAENVEGRDERDCRAR